MITTEQINEFLGAIKDVSHGDQTPMGFEALVMALHGQGSPGSGGSIRQSLDEIAAALNNVADAIRQQKFYPDP